jgi:hypothetical protein
MFQTCVTCSSASLGSEVIDPRTECSTAKILPEVISVVGHGGHGGHVQGINPFCGGRSPNINMLINRLTTIDGT